MTFEELHRLVLARRHAIRDIADNIVQPPQFDYPTASSLHVDIVTTASSNIRTATAVIAGLVVAMEDLTDNYYRLRATDPFASDMYSFDAGRQIAAARMAGDTQAADAMASMLDIGNDLIPLLQRAREERNKATESYYAIKGVIAQIENEEPIEQ